MKKILTIVLIILAALAVVAALVLGYFGLVPGVATLFGSDKPRDLGVTYTYDDYLTAGEKAYVNIILKEGEIEDENSLELIKTRKVSDVRFTDEELTAVVNENQDLWKFYPVEDVQVLINDDGTAEVSGMLLVDRLEQYAAVTGTDYEAMKAVVEKYDLFGGARPFYARGKATVRDNVVNFNLEKAEIGRVPVSKSTLTESIQEINAFFSMQLDAYDGLYVQRMDLDDGEMQFDGRFPKAIKSYR